MPRFARLFPVVLAGFLLAGCEDTMTSTSQETTTYTGNKLAGHVYVLLRDQVTSSPLAGAKVSLLGDSATVHATDSLGWTSFSGLTPGQYLVKVEKTGYAGRIVTATLVDGSSDVPRVVDVSLDLDLPRLGASATGKVYSIDRLGNSLPLSGDTIDLYYAAPAVGSWIADHFLAVSDSQGSYSFQNLPEDIQASISARSVSLAGTVYAPTATGTVSGLKSGESRFVPAFSLTASIEAFSLLSDNLSAIALTDSVVLSFSQAVDTTALRSGDVSDSAGNQLVAIVSSWAAKATRLVVKPFAGRWPAGSNALHLNLKSTQGAVVAQTLRFTAGTVNALPGQAGAIGFTSSYQGRDTALVNGNTGLVNFKWGKASGADGYDLYKKARGDNAFVKVASTSKRTDTTLGFVSTDYFLNGDTVAFLVVATNAKGSAPLSGAPQVVLTDRIRPELLSSPGEFALPPSLANGSGTKTLVLDTVDFSFSEDMDTTQSAQLTFTNKDTVAFDASKLSITWSWISRSTGRVTLGVKPGKDATGLNAEISVSLSALKDENGNAFLAPLQNDWLILVAK